MRRDHSPLDLSAVQDQPKGSLQARQFDLVTQQWQDAPVRECLKGSAADYRPVTGPRGVVEIPAAHPLVLTMCRQVTSTFFPSELRAATPVSVPELMGRI